MIAAVDLGATSGRVVVGRIRAGRVGLEVVHRFSNGPVSGDDGLHWEVHRLFDEVVVGLAAARRAAPDLRAVGVDTWAVDYGLLAAGRLLGEPFHYRDERTAAGVDAVHGSIGRDELFAVNGLQFLPFNTVYQLAADRLAGRLAAADTALLIPDLIAYWLTGIAATERTNASTTGLLDVTTSRWNDELYERLDLPALFPPLIDAGTALGRTTVDLTRRLGGTLDVIAVGSHDTASAVVAVPMDPTGAAYISCGTWALVGVELETPRCTSAARAANFTNELGVDGRVRFLRNVMGLWVLNQCVSEWRGAGEEVDLAALLAAAGALDGEVTTFEVDHPSLAAPGPMEHRVREQLAAAGAPPPMSRPVLVRSIVESLAQRFAAAVDEAAEISGVDVDTVHLVGGGALNELLCQLTADRCSRVVIAGPVEATALGNALVAARAVGLVTGDLDDLRTLVRASVELRRHEPRPRRTARPV